MAALRKAHPALLLAIAAVLAIRLAVQLIMPQPVVSDGLAYQAMAHSLAQGGPMRDTFGSVAFYSPGYPLILALGLAMSIPALMVNLVLAGVSTWLIARLALRLTRDLRPALLAVAGYAVWLPSLLSASTLAKENLTTPLLLGMALAILDLSDGKRPVRAAALAGACYGAGLLAGASSLLIAAAVPLALALRWQRQGSERLFSAVLAFLLATTVVVGPWLIHTARHFGHPVLTTNSGFNLYLGNNPAATGNFVSIADTPLGPQWHRMRAELGEDGSATALATAARSYVATHPARTAELAAVKLGLFWAPNIPDVAEQAHPAMAALRWLDVTQHSLILLLGAMGLLAWRRAPATPVLAIIIASFWVVHALTYVMVRYREPVMPILIVFAAIAVWMAIVPRRLAA